MPATHTVALVCEAARRAAIERGIAPAEKAVVVPNGIRVESFDIASSRAREQLRQMLALPAQTQVIGTVGRLNWTKDQAGLIRAFRLVHDRQPSTALVLIGDGELRAELEQCAAAEGIADAVHFLGDRSDVRTLLQGLDVFVLSSLSEGYSMALLEACAVRLPIIATDVGGNGEIIRDGSTGVLVPPSDPSALAQAIVGLLQQPARAQALADAARVWVRTEGSLEAMAERYAGLYGAPSA
jgi:glycosyltransferase involved in cell wall biosynthesis